MRDLRAGKLLDAVVVGIDNVLYVIARSSASVEVRPADLSRLETALYDKLLKVAQEKAGRVRCPVHNEAPRRVTAVGSSLSDLERRTSTT